MVTCSLLDKALLQLKFERREGQLRVLRSSSSSGGAVSSSERRPETVPTPSRSSSHATGDNSFRERAVHWAPILELDDAKCHQPGAVLKPCKPILKADMCLNGQRESMHLNLGEESGTLKQTVQSLPRTMSIPSLLVPCQLNSIEKAARRTKRSVDDTLDGDGDTFDMVKRYCRVSLRL
jgi:hypothetical protein